MGENDELKIGTRIVVNDLKYECKKIKKGMTGFIIKSVDTCNRNNWKRYTIYFPEIEDCRNLYDSEFEIKEFEGNFEEYYSIKYLFNSLSKAKLKGENDMFNGKLEEISTPSLGVWEEIMKSKIGDYFENKERDLIKKDIINNEIESFRKDFSKLLSDNGFEYEKISVLVYKEDCKGAWRDEIRYTHSTKLDIEENKKLYNQSIDNLHKLCGEIRSVLNMCENFDNAISVLRDYGVIENESFKINHDFDFMKFIKVDLEESKNG